jgi:hypothetical protein
MTANHAAAGRAAPLYLLPFEKGIDAIVPDTFEVCYRAQPELRLIRLIQIEQAGAGEVRTLITVLRFTIYQQGAAPFY